MSRVYILEDNTYTVSKCLTEDIEQHYSLVSEFIPNINKTTYTKRMEQSIEQQLAWKVQLNGALVGFIYTICNNGVGEGVSIWGNNAIAFIPLLKEAFYNYPSHKIQIEPHKNEFVLYKSLLSENSIKNYHTLHTPLNINLRKIVAKYEDVYTKIGFIDG